MSSVIDPRTAGFTQPEVEARYHRYVQDMHGDLSDVARLCETFFNAGGRHAVEAMTEMGDIVPMLQKIERRTARVRAIFESFRA